MANIGNFEEPFTPFERALRKREQRWKRSTSETPAAHLGAPAQGELFSIPGHALPATSLFAPSSEEKKPEASFLDAILASTQPFHELPIVVDDSIPPDTLELRSRDGRLLGAITGIGWDPGEPPEWCTEEIPV